MYYRLSNTTERMALEKEFGIPLRFPDVYNPSPLINGFHEAVLPVITSEENNIINYTIWGLLPEKYEDDWETFQRTFNTLNLTKEMIYEDEWCSELLSYKRCLVIVSGFFTSYLYQGNIYPYYVHLAGKKPFCLAGIYNQLDDGFITTSLILSEADSFIKKIHNVDNFMPTVVPRNLWQTWLDPETENYRIWDIMHMEVHPEFIAYPISKEMYKNDIVYDSMLEPVNYKNIPNAIRNSSNTARDR